MGVIIACPECGSRYRLPDTTVAENARMRCAACDNRWVVAAAMAEEPLVPSSQPEPDPPQPPIVEPIRVPEPDPEPVREPKMAHGSTLLRTLVAIAIGAALALAAAALWLRRVDPADLPLIGDQLARLSTPAVALTVTFTARTSELTSGDRLLEINGQVTNRGATRIDVPPLEARLAGPGGTVRRWRITVPTAGLDPGKSAAFASTATDFPADATIVAIRPGR